MAADTDKPQLTERYRSAVHSPNLKVDARTTVADSDVVGAMGFAHRILTQGFRQLEGATEPVKPAPLAVPLERLFAGDSGAAREIVELLADMIWRHGRKLEVRINRVEASDMAKACLAWHRDGSCRPCGGLGFARIVGTPMLSDRHCEHCGGGGKIPFDEVFKIEHRELARWSVVQMQLEAGRASIEAMRSLAERMQL